MLNNNKKLIEVALPLEAINNGCAQEKNPFLKGHPRSTHLWWARRPLAAARAVIFSQMVDDPSSHPERFPTQIEQEAERVRLFGIIENLVKWENVHNEDILASAHEEILKNWRDICDVSQSNPQAAELFNPDKVPALHDPFAGGGTIPLEAQRLGLEAYASDLNPVAVMINKAMIEIPPRFEGQPPVNPASSHLSGVWPEASGLADDVRYYGEWMRKQALKRIGHIYPKVKDRYGFEHSVIAWIWARTVKCPNPVCGCEMPLASSFELSKKKGKETYIQPIIEGKKVRYEIGYGKVVPKPPKIARGAKFMCVCCGGATTPEYIKNEALARRTNTVLMAIVADSKVGRLYFSPDEVHIAAAKIDKPADYPTQELANDPRNIWCLSYGLDSFDKLFTNRQLVALVTFSELITEVRSQIERDGGNDEYAKAISVYLACGVSQICRYSCSICGWNKTNENVAQVFGRQAIPMVWDFAESNTLEGPLNITSTIEWVASVGSVKISVLLPSRHFK